MTTELMTPDIVAARLSTSVNTLKKWRIAGTGPRYMKFGETRQAKVKYRAEDVEAWIATRGHILENTSQL